MKRGSQDIPAVPQKCLLNAARIAAVAMIALTFACRAKGPVDNCPEINGDGARLLIANQQAMLLDVRDASEFAKDHIEGAVNTPLDELESRTRLLDEETVLITYCGTGRRAHRAAERLRERGFTVYELGAMEDWTKKGNKCLK